MRKRLYFFIAGLGILALLFFGIYKVYSTVDQDEAPRLQAGARYVEVGPSGVSFTWRVKNFSDRVVTFDEDAFLQIRADSQRIPYPIEAKSLAPGEVVSLDVFLPNLSPTQCSELKLTAASNEGTIASHIIHLE